MNEVSPNRNKLVLLGMLCFMIVATTLFGMHVFDEIGRPIGSDTQTAEEGIRYFSEREEWFSLYSFLETNDIYYGRDELEGYELIIRAASDYGRTYEEILDLLFPKDYYDKERTLEFMADDLNRFLDINTKDLIEWYDLEEEINLEAYRKMTDDLGVLIKAYFHMTEEEWDLLCRSSDAERIRVLQEAYHANFYE